MLNCSDVYGSAGISISVTAWISLIAYSLFSTAY